MTPEIRATSIIESIASFVKPITPYEQTLMHRIIMDAIQADRDLCAKSIAVQATPLISHTMVGWVEGRPHKVTVGANAHADLSAAYADKVRRVVRHSSGVEL